MFRKYYAETVRERLEQIYHARDFYRAGDVAPSNVSDSSSSRPDGDDGKLKDSGKKRSVRTSVPVGKVGGSSVSSGKQNTKANRSKRRRIYNLKQKKKKRLDKKIYIY